MLQAGKDIVECWFSVFPQVVNDEEEVSAQKWAGQYAHCQHG